MTTTLTDARALAVSTESTDIHQAPRQDRDHHMTGGAETIKTAMKAATEGAGGVITVGNAQVVSDMNAVTVSRVPVLLCLDATAMKNVAGVNVGYRIQAHAAPDPQALARDLLINASRTITDSAKTAAANFRGRSTSRICPLRKIRKRLTRTAPRNLQQ